MTPWVRVDLPFACHIKKVIVINRISVAQENAKNLIIVGSLNKDFKPYFNVFKNDNSVWDLKEIVFDFDVFAQYLKFSFADENYFHLKKIEVYVDLTVELRNYYLFDCCFVDEKINALKEVLGESFDTYLDKDLSIVLFDNSFTYTANVRYCINIISQNKCSLALKFIHDSKYNRYIITLFSLMSDLQLLFEFNNRNLLIHVSDDLDLFFIRNKFQKIHDLIYFWLTRFVYCVNNFSFNISSNSQNRYVIINADLMGRFGFADRLRGVLTVIKWCLDLRLEYFIIFNKPFALNKYYKFKTKVKVDDKLITFNGIRNRIASFNIETLDERGDDLVKKLLSDSLDSFDSVQLSTNFGYKWHYTLFTQNFVRTDFLNNELIKIKKIIGFKYISVSFRFLGKFGDFNEPGAVILDDKNKDKLLESCSMALKSFISEKKGVNILVLSDSTVFLNYVDGLPNIYVFPDNIAHSSLIAKSESPIELQQKAFEKTIIDFNLIMDAEEIYLFKNEQTYKSLFPLTAAACLGKKCMIKYF